MTIQAFTGLLICACFLVGDISAASVCYDKYGCFSDSVPFDDFSVLPQKPEAINTHYIVYTIHNQNDSYGQPVQWSNTFGIFGTYYHGIYDTKIIVPGFRSTPRDKWVMDMKDALLKEGDFNVVVLDWAGGTNTSYEQTAANARLVALQLYEFMAEAIGKEGSTFHQMHLIGHGIGAHLCGYAGERSGSVGRITGLDPAGPMFEGNTHTTHLDKDDAQWVDIIHTDGSVIGENTGYGTLVPTGDIDFYPNGGQWQRGCGDNSVAKLFQHTSDINHTATCSHNRAYEFFIDSAGNSCKFLGVKCADFTEFETDKCTLCGPLGCPIMGYEGDKIKETGSFYLGTGEAAPFCGHNYFVEIKMSSSFTMAYGEILITIAGHLENSGELHFSRTASDYAGGAVEMHVVTSHADVGNVQSVIVKFEKGTGLGAIGSGDSVVIHELTVHSFFHGTRDTFCGHNSAARDGQLLVLTTVGTC